jgi:hypothetical protein
LPPSATVKIESVSPVVDIGGDESVAPVGNITSLTTTGDSLAGSSTSPERSFEVVDERISTLNATTRRLKAEAERRKQP